MTHYELIFLVRSGGTFPSMPEIPISGIEIGNDSCERSEHP